MKISVFGLLTFLVIMAAVFLWGPSITQYTSLKIAPYTSSAYAVQLISGQQVYGRIKSVSSQWITLRDVYYFQSVEINGATTNNLVAQKSNTLTDPDNYMIINRKNILSLERIGPAAKLRDIVEW
jgi:hypothetical protein